MLSAGDGKLYLTDILVDMTLYITLAFFVVSGCHVREGPERFNKMRLIREMTLIGDFSQRQVRMMDQVHRMQVFFIEQDLFGIHAGRFRHFS